MLDLYPHQRAAVDFLQSRTHACLADDQGLGKTISVAVAARELGVSSLTVVAPSVALWNWQRELQKWLGGPMACVIDSSKAKAAGARRITSHALVRKQAVRDMLPGGDLLVVDESHCFRNPKAQQTRALFGELAGRFERVWCLTGTPAPNSYACELWTMLHHLADFPESYHRFRSRYCTLRADPFDPTGYRPTGNRNVGELKRRMGGFILRRLKSAVLDLPPRRTEIVTVRPKVIPPGLADLERKLRRRAVTPENVAARQDIADVDTPEEAFRALRDHEHMSRFRRLSGAAKVEPAVELLQQEFANGLPCVVVFAQHTEVVDALAAALAQHKPVVVDGRSSARERDAAVAAFQEGRANVFIGQIQAAGTAITLTRATDALFVELSWTPGDNAQCADRIYRIGQTQPVRVRFLALAHSVDEIVADVVRRKVSAMQELLA